MIRILLDGILHPLGSLTHRNSFSEWPEYIPGLICKTPPVGRIRAERFAQCCSGKVDNITSPTTPEDEAYPMSCATFCQIDPERAKANEKYPYGWSDHFMCLLGGDEESNWEVTCATITVEGKPMPTSFETTPTGPWMTSDYSTWFWFQDADETEEPVRSTATSNSGVSITYISYRVN